MTETTVRLDRDGPVAVISLDRPEKHNAADDAMDARFFELLAELHDEPDVRCVVWRGEGPSFSSGRDTTALGQRPGGISDLDFIGRGHRWTERLLTCPVPIVVALHGWVLGGSLERALLCDLRIAAEDVKLALPEVGHGVIPDSAGVARLFQMCGPGVASDLALTGRVIGAEEALRHGIVSRVVPTEELDARVLEVAHTIAGRSPVAVRLARHVLHELGTPEVLATLRREWLAQTAVMADPSYDRGAPR